MKMDFNFGETKKQASAAVDDIFGHAADATKQAGHDLMGGFAADNAHTEKSFGVGQKEVDIDQLDPQAFVQRMSAEAKEAQEQLDAKFSKNANDVDDFLVQSSNNAKQGVASLTTDFMNAERGFMAGAGDVAKDVEKKAAQAVDDIFGHFGNGDSLSFKPSAPVADATAANKASIIDEPPAMASFAKPTTTTTAATAAAVGNKDSDTESPSISYNPSPAKKMPAADALKEQDNEKFISSENLLGDFNADERTATPDSQASGIFSAPLAAPVFKPQSQFATTDLDDDFEDNFVQAEIPKQPEQKITVAAPIVEPPKPAPVPAPVAKPAPVVPEPVKIEPTVKEVKKETPAPTPAPAAVTKPVVPKPTSTSQQQPNIVSVEDIFYKYGLGKWNCYVKYFAAGLV